MKKNEAHEKSAVVHEELHLASSHVYWNKIFGCWYCKPNPLQGCSWCKLQFGEYRKRIQEKYQLAYPPALQIWTEAELKKVLNEKIRRPY